VRVKDLATQLGINEAEIINISGKLQIPARHFTSFLRQDEILLITQEHKYRKSSFFKKLAYNFFYLNSNVKNSKSNI
jgi:hypothetical protein